MNTMPIVGQRGASAVEYALMVALVAAVIVATILVLGGSVSGLFEDTTNSLDHAVNP